MSSSVTLRRKIKQLNDTIWDNKVKESQLNAWLANFVHSASGTEAERQLHGLYLLSQFIYFGSRQMRELMLVLFRDFYKYPIVEDIRKRHGDTIRGDLIQNKFDEALKKTLFLGVGNPSESGSHLLYYFRQENGLPKTHFIHTHDIFERRALTRWQVLKSLILDSRGRYGGGLGLRHPKVTRYVFIDDFCGSGQQAQSYSTGTVEDIKALNPEAEVSYFVLCGTSTGMNVVRDNTAFDYVRCVFELDESFRCFSQMSRYFPSLWPNEIKRDFAERMCREYGHRLTPMASLGYEDCQLLIAFQHNTPDNTLPIFWSEGSDVTPWRPVFKRYPKLYE